MYVRLRLPEGRKSIITGMIIMDFLSICIVKTKPQYIYNIIYYYYYYIIILQYYIIKNITAFFHNMKSPIDVHRWLKNSDATLHLATHVFLCTYYYMHVKFRVFFYN